MTEKIPAIPTEYAGVQFRSRLEARHAAFFDLVGWSWQYEPWDLEKYIPDFVIGNTLVIECKPSTGDGWQIPALSRAHRSVVRNLGHPVVVSGSHPWKSGGLLAMGYTVPNWGLITYDHEAWFAHCGECRGLTLCCVPPDLDGWCMRCQLTGLQALAPGAPGVVTLWREAGNIVQWRAADEYAFALVQASKEES